MSLTPELLTKALSDITRLRIMMLLLDADELCVCELMSVLQLDQPKISRHLALLRKNELVSDRRAAQWIHYKINPTTPDWALNTLQALADGAQQCTPYSDDRLAMELSQRAAPQTVNCR